ncbi:hypothetical protein B0J12DRAFT_55214 [Macrophomina phaseolina]|uniref:Glycoside hydrolase n=1 Tax=Macrophomina phaseolina TaxID=35725 RepID=A0ABQ8GEK5_9PEZI|nr:hypothetical protein B0J12DRAFT_55214 [Macrophomina phaseolina]
MFSIATLAVLAPFLGLSQASPYPPEVAAPIPPVTHVGYRVAAWNGTVHPSKTENVPTLTRRATGGVVTSGAAVSTINNQDGIGGGSDTYRLYTGDGSLEAGWPTKEQWVSFEDMFNNNKQIMFNSCGWNGWGANDSGPEIGAIYDAIQQIAQETKVDHRFILAVIIQESKGCVRVPTTGNIDPNIWNPGLMQDHSGDATCNDGQTVQNPCPTSTIFQMVREGTAGTTRGDGLAHVINQAQNTYHVTKSRAFYLAARYYNSGSIGASGNLEDGCCTHCYASDIANRLTGWVLADSKCYFDG